MLQIGPFAAHIKKIARVASQFHPARLFRRLRTVNFSHRSILHRNARKLWVSRWYVVMLL